jgi:predicted nucleic acid-binding protein
MVVVADTSPINYLILIDHIGVLQSLYSRVAIPHSVYAELIRPAAPESVRKWMGCPPDWIELRTPSSSSDAVLDRLETGERDAILLASELLADQLIVDDLAGRREAQRRGLRVTGTIGVLREAAGRGLLNLKSAVALLQATNFYIASDVLAQILRDVP